MVTTISDWDSHVGMIKRKLVSIVRKHGSHDDSPTDDDHHQHHQRNHSKRSSVNSTEYDEITALDMMQQPEYQTSGGTNLDAAATSSRSKKCNVRSPLIDMKNEEMPNSTKTSIDDTSRDADSVSTASNNSSPAITSGATVTCKDSTATSTATPPPSSSSATASSSITSTVASHSSSQCLSPLTQNNEISSSNISESPSSISILPINQSTPIPATSKSKSGSDSKKKKSTAWYNVLSPTYKSKSEDFKRIFKDVPNDERLIIDYSCALQKDILIQGRMYISQNFICFYANIFRWETILTIKFEDITSITKERTARVIPNAVQITTADDKYFFTSFGARDKTHIVLFRLWHNCLLDQPLSAQDQWRWVHFNYGDELGLTSSDDDYISTKPSGGGKRKNIFSPNGCLTAIGHSGDLPERSESAGELLVKETWISSSMQNLPPAEQLNNQRKDEIKDSSPGSSLKDLETHWVSDLKKSHLDASTDPGNTSTDEEDEVHCEGHTHKDIHCLDEVFDMPVDALFSRLFANSLMFQNFMIARKSTDLVMSEWTEPDNNGVRHRELTFTLSLSHAIGPNCSYSTEKQTCDAGSRAGSNYMVDAEFTNAGIPYGECFCVINRYCLLRVSSCQSRLRVTADIIFKKKPFGLVKNYIQKTATQGILDNFSMLGEHIRRECLLISGDASLEIPTAAMLVPTAASTSAVSSSIVRKRCFRKKRFPSMDPSSRQSAEHSSPAIEQSSNAFFTKGATSNDLHSTFTDHLTITFNVYTVTRILLFIMLTLLFFNGVMYFRMITLETTAASLSDHKTIEPIFFDKNTIRTNDEWLKILNKQRHLYGEDIRKWRQKLTETLQQLDIARESIITLANRVDYIAKSMRDVKET